MDYLTGLDVDQEVEETAILSHNYAEILLILAIENTFQIFLQIYEFFVLSE